MEDETLIIKVEITGDGSKDLTEHLENIIEDGIKTYGIITSYDILN